METLNYNQNQEIIFHILKSFSIPITFSDDEPPKLKNNKKLDEYPVDELMGEYCRNTRRIIIYQKGINRAVNDLSDKIKVANLYENLLKIVIFHEIGHYWFHNIEFEIKYDHYYPEDCFNPKINNPVIIEWIAQMFAYYCIKDDNDIAKTMDLLAETQPPEYKSYLLYKNLEINEFKKNVAAFQFVSSDLYCGITNADLNEINSEIEITAAIDKATKAKDLIIILPNYNV